MNRGLTDGPACGVGGMTVGDVVVEVTGTATGKIFGISGVGGGKTRSASGLFGRPGKLESL